jgi:hypothetical protein
VNAIAGAVSVVIEKPVMSGSAGPTGVGTGIGSELRKLPGGSTLGKPSPFRDSDDEPPAKESYSYRFWANRKAKVRKLKEVL